MLNLLPSFGKQGVSYGLSTIIADVNDTQYLSKYFVISEFSSKFTAGRNSFSLNGSTFLLPGSEIFIECLDSAGHNLFIEMATTTDATAKSYAYKEGTSYIFSIHVYNDIADGVGKIICYGTLADNRTVKWQQNIIIDKTLNNSSRVRFYNDPILEVNSVLTPVLNSDISLNTKQPVVFAGNGYSLAIIPQKDTNFSSVNMRNTNIDYRFVVDSPSVIGNILDDKDGFNSQMIGSKIILSINKIQKPFSSQEIIPTEQNFSSIISNVTTNNTLRLTTPYFYSDQNNNQIITNISDANFVITYPYINYNLTSSYQTSSINDISYIIKQSYADIIYRNIRTFTGFLARHKIYRKSLVSNADFSVIADEPIFVNEQLRDNLTQNKFYELLGKFYNDQHISRYWFTSSNNLQMVHTPNVFIDSCQLTSSNYNSLLGNDYIIVKNDSVNIDRNAIYIPFNLDQFNNTSGSAYDSNFIALKSNVQYILQVDAVIQKDYPSVDSRLEFYFTSSISAAKSNQNFNSKYGIKLATLNADKMGNYNNFNNEYFFFIPQEDLYGTMVIVPYKCQPYLKNISFRVYGDDGFSPDLFISRVPWPIVIPNEAYQIKSELFDINHNLVYSNLYVVQNFDPSGSSLTPYIPGGGIYQTTFFPTLTPRSDSEISYSRLVTRIDNSSPPGQLKYTPIVDSGVNNEYIYVLTGSLNTYDVLRGQSINSIYSRKIYWDGSGNKQVETI